MVPTTPRQNALHSGQYALPWVSSPIQFEFSPQFLCILSCGHTERGESQLIKISLTSAAPSRKCNIVLGSDVHLLFELVKQVVLLLPCQTLSLTVHFGISHLKLLLLASGRSVGAPLLCSML